MATKHSVRTICDLVSGTHAELVENVKQARAMIQDLDGKTGVVEVRVKQGDSYINTPVSAHEMRKSLQFTIAKNNFKISNIEKAAQTLWDAAYE